MVLISSGVNSSGVEASTAHPGARSHASRQALAALKSLICTSCDRAVSGTSGCAAELTFCCCQSAAIQQLHTVNVSFIALADHSKLSTHRDIAKQLISIAVASLKTQCWRLLMAVLVSPMRIHIEL